MKRLLWVLLFVVAVLIAASDEFSIKLGKDGSHMMYSFPAWTDTPWFVIDTRK